MQIVKDNRVRILSLGLVIALTLGIHYGWVLQPIFGEAHWIHAMHGRFCYIPIVIAASWFGLRGGIIAASLISILVLPYIFARDLDIHTYVGELTELVFYFAIAILTGALIDREFFARRKQEQAQLQAEKSQKLSLVGQIAAGVAHEIKNPLASIKGAADIISDDATSEGEKKEFKGILQNEVRRIDGTVTEFLEFARPKEIKLEPLDLSELISSCVRQVEVQAREEQIRIDSQIDDGVRVNGDSEKVQQMTLNLLLNALQASQSSTAVSVSLNLEPGGHARLMIKDSGSGIEEKNLPHIFEPFFTTKSSGTGLGLAIVKTIVESHRGEITITPNEGQGMTVTVSIPALSERE